MTLKEWRESHGVKQVAVADYLGIARQTYAAYEANQTDMSVEMAIRACEFMHAPFDLIFLPCDVSSNDITPPPRTPTAR